MHIINYVKQFALICSLIAVLFIFASNYALPVFTVIIILALAYIVAQFKLSHLFKLMVLVIPLAIKQQVFDTEVTLLMPSEPIEAIITLAFGFKILFGYKISSRIIKHPLFWLMLLGIAIQFVAIFNSEIILVSLKSMVLKACYFMVFFVLAADLYLKQEITHIQVLKTYIFSLFIVGVVIFLKHIEFGLSKDISGTVPEPFYADHTIYSACLAFLLPLPLLVFFNSKSFQINFYQKWWIGCLSVIMLTFLFFTYCRAGWISFVIAFIVAGAVFFGLRFKALIALVITALLILFAFQSQIMQSVKQNKADSNAKNASLEQQTKSVANITNDQSNAERLNRWSCAWRMFLDKPLLGYGPGTYQFIYLGYQKKSEMTRISVTSPYNIKKGKGGTAHSEYLLLLSETGIFSLILYLASIFMAIYYAIKVYAKSENVTTRTTMLVVFFGFCTYILHAFFNNFLDTDKAALLYYTSVAAILVEAISLQNKENKNPI